MFDVNPVEKETESLKEFSAVLYALRNALSYMVLQVFLHMTRHATTGIYSDHRVTARLGLSRKMVHFQNVFQYANLLAKSGAIGK